MANTTYKNFTIVEIGNDSTKMIAGSYSEPEPFIYCVKETPCRNVLDNGYPRSDRTNEIANALAEVLNVQDETICTKCSTQKIFVLLPPNGFRVFRTHEVSAVMGRSNNDGRIDKEDIHQLLKNIYTRTRQEYNDYNLVEVLPYVYEYGGRTSVTPPIGEIAEQIGVRALGHIVPYNLERSFETAIKRLSVTISGYGVSPYGAYSLISKERKDLSEYLILDLGGYSTVVSVVGQKSLFNSETLNSGMNSLTETIAEKFRIDYKEAERLKRIYGYSERKTLFDAPIIRNEAGEAFYQGNLNQIIENWFANFNIKLNACINEALRVHREGSQAALQIVERCPILLIGGGANLLGIETLLAKALGSHKMEKFIPSVAGARDPKYVNLLGYLLARCTSDLQIGNEEEQTVLTRS